MTTALPLSRFIPMLATGAASDPAIDAVGRRCVWFIVLIWAAAPFIGFIPALSILTMAGFAAAFVGLAKPAVGVFAVGVLCTLDALTRFYLLSGGLLRWNSFNYLMIVALLLTPGEAVRLSDEHTKILTGFALLLGLQLTITPDLATGLHTMLNVLSPFGILLYVARTKYDPQVIAWLGTITGVLGAIGGLVFYLQINQLPQMNNNAWSAFPLTSLFCICFSYVLVPPDRQLRLSALAAVNAVWVFLSGSRGGMFVGLVCIVFLIMRTRSREHRLLWFVGGPAIATLLIGVFSATSDRAVHRVDVLFDSERELESRTSGRSDLYVVGWRIFSENPFGVGTGGFPRELSRRADRDIVYAGKELGAHSAWTKVLTENGVFGILVLVAWVVSFAVSGLRSQDNDFAAAGLLVTFILASAFFSREFHSKGLWLAPALFIALEYQQKRRGEMVS